MIQHTVVKASIGQIIFFVVLIKKIGWGISWLVSSLHICIVVAHIKVFKGRISVPIAAGVPGLFSCCHSWTVGSFFVTEKVHLAS